MRTLRDETLRLMLQDPDLDGCVRGLCTEVLALRARLREFEPREIRKGDYYESGATGDEIRQCAGDRPQHPPKYRIVKIQIPQPSAEAKPEENIVLKAFNAEGAPMDHRDDAKAYRARPLHVPEPAPVLPTAEERIETAKACGSRVYFQFTGDDTEREMVHPDAVPQLMRDHAHASVAAARRLWEIEAAMAKNTRPKVVRDGMRYLLADETAMRAALRHVAEFSAEYSIRKVALDALLGEVKP